MLETKIIVDTNIIINGLFFSNKYPYDVELLKMIEKKSVNLIISTDIDKEIRDTVMMIAKIKKYSLDKFDEKIYCKINNCLNLATKVFPRIKTNYSKHSLDNKFIDAVIESGSSYLISNNIDLTEITDNIQDMYNFKICSPFQFKLFVASKNVRIKFNKK